jgi:hypothetical protein
MVDGRRSQQDEPMTKLRTRLIAFAAAAAVLTLTLIPGATAANASNASNAAALLASIDNFRASNASLTPLKANGFIDAYAQDLAVQYAKCGLTCIPGAKTSEVPPAGGSFNTFAEKASGSGIIGKLSLEYAQEWGPFLLAPNYGSVGYVTKGSTDYTILVVATYASPPLDLMRAGNVTITGTARVGATLTGHSGTFSPTPSQVTYHWTSNGNTVGSLLSSTYTPVASDVGHIIHLVVVGIKAGYQTASDGSSNTAPVALGHLQHPAKQVIIGHPNVGSDLTAATTGWQSGTSLSAQWFRNNKKISGQIYSTYHVLPADKGKKIDVRIIGVIAGYAPVTLKSHSTHKIGPTRLTAPATVNFTGVATYTHTLTAQPGSWGPGTVHFSYQWNLNGKKVHGATHSTFKLPASSADKNVTVTVTGHRTGWASVSVTSSSSLVQSLEFTGGATVSFSIPSTLKTGALLTAHAGAWSPTPTTYKYFWYRNGVPISATSSKTYKLKSTDNSASFSVMAEVFRAGYDSTAGFSPTVAVNW